MVAMVRLPVSGEDGQKRLLHPLLAFYVADLPETGDLLGMKRGSQTFTPCHTCFAKRGDFPYSTSVERQTLRHTKELMNNMN